MTANELATALRMRADGQSYDEMAATTVVSASTVSRAIAAELVERQVRA